MSGRCKSCNNKLKNSEIIWDKAHHTHEELCLVCRASLFEGDEDDAPLEGVIYLEDLESQ